MHSALVAPGTASALLRALQTAPDKHAYRIPDTTDKEYSSDIPGFELTGWIQPHGESHGRDRQDPYAKSVKFPPTRPTDTLRPLEALVADADYRLWRDGANVVVVSRAWDNYVDERQTNGSAGETLTVDRCWLASVLEQLSRWLIVEIEVRRRLDDTTYRGSRRADDNEDDDGMFFPLPYTKYFLINTSGEVHEF